MSINAEVDQRTLREIYLAAFERVVKKAQPWTVMAAYNRVNGTFASENPFLLQTILKDEWGFEGVVVSDWGAVNEKPQALAAGLDLEMPGPGAGHTQRIARLVREGALEEAALDRAAGRVLKLILKGQAGRRQGAAFDQAAHHALARQAAADSIVLLKNAGDLLPLNLADLDSVAVIGQFAKTPRYQGSGSSQVVPTRLSDSYSELEALLGSAVKLGYAEGYSQSEQPDESLLAEAVDQARQASVALIFVGLPGSFESEGFDRKHIFLPESHNRLIEEVCKVQPNSVIILHNGSVVAMPWVNQPKAILEAGLGGQAVGGAIVDVLSGRVNPSGKLAETFPFQLEDTPAYLNYPGEAGQVRYGEGLFVGYRYYDKKKVRPLFPFGYGLSYTSFEYSNLTANKTEIKAGESLEVSVSVRNSGPRPGKEVVQLYIRAASSEFMRPDKELKAFTKVELGPGESREVKLSLEERDFMVYDLERQTWRIEGGSYEILVGGSSVDLPVSLTLIVKADPRLSRRTFTKLSPLTYFLQDPRGRELVEQFVSGTPLAGWLAAEGEMFSTIPIGKLAIFGQVPEAAINDLIARVNQADPA
jgi:beta-glucosidase